MNTIKVFIITAALIIIAGCAMDTAGTDSPENSAPGQNSHEAAPQVPINVNSEEDLASKTNYGFVIVKSKSELNSAFFASYGAELTDRMAIGTTYYHYVRKNENIAGLLSDLKASNKVLLAEPDIILEPDTSHNGYSSLNDPYLASSQYAAYVTGLKEAWHDFGVGPNQIYAAIVDTGINMVHEDLSGAIHKGYSYFQRDAGRFYTWIGSGREPIEMDQSNWDNNPKETHGTRVAGVVAAKGNNGKGIAGVCPDNVKLIIYKVFARNPNGKEAPGSGSLWITFSTIKHLVRWKTENNITQTIPVNMSLGDEYASQFAIDLIHYGLEHDVVIIASAGNDGRTAFHYPAAYPGVIAVGASRGNDTKAYFSNSGDYISVIAPGMQIISTGTDNNSSYITSSGTSLAAPFVTGLTAYLLTFDPHLKPARIKQLIEDNADDLGTPGFDRHYGNGRVQVFNTVKALLEDDDEDPKYTNHTLKIEVTNNNLPVENQNVYLYDQQGRYVTMTPTNQEGIAFFNLLKTGTYTAKANYLGQLGKAEHIDFTNPAADVTCQIGFTIENRWFIQTLENEGALSAHTDTAIVLYDAQGTKLKECDNGKKDTLEYILEPGKTYIISVKTFKGEEGHYGFSISQTKKVSAQGSDPLAQNYNDKYEPNNDPGNATPVTAGEIYNCFAHSKDIDFFTFTVPAGN